MKNKLLLYGLSFGSQFIVTILISLFTIHYYKAGGSVKLFYDLNTVTFIATILTLGIPQALIRFQLIGEVDKNDLNTTVTISCIFTTVVCIFVSWLIGGFNSIFLTLLIPFTFAQYYLRSLEKYKEFIFLYVFRLIIIIIAAGILYYFRNIDPIYWYLIVGGSYCVSFIFQPPMIQGSFNWQLFKKLLRYSIPLQLYSFLLQGIFLFAQFSLEKFGNHVDFQEYVITWRMIQILQAISALIFFFYPQYYFNYIEKRPKTVIRTQNLIIGVLFGVSLGILAFKPFLDYLFKFQFSYLYIGILLCSELFRLAAGIMNTKYSYHMNNRFLLITLVLCVIIISILAFLKYNFIGPLRMIDVSLLLLICFFAYFLITKYYSNKINVKK